MQELEEVALSKESEESENYSTDEISIAVEDIESEIEDELSIQIRDEVPEAFERLIIHRPDPTSRSIKEFTKLPGKRKFPFRVENWAEDEEATTCPSFAELPASSLNESKINNKTQGIKGRRNKNKLIRKLNKENESLFRPFQAAKNKNYFLGLGDMWDNEQNAQRVHPRVGDKYQITQFPIIKPFCGETKALNPVERWNPNILSPKIVDEYLKKSMEYWLVVNIDQFEAEEDLLHLLHICNYNTELALNVMQTVPEEYIRSHVTNRQHPELLEEQEEKLNTSNSTENILGKISSMSAGDLLLSILDDTPTTVMEGKSIPVRENNIVTQNSANSRLFFKPKTQNKPPSFYFPRYKLNANQSIALCL